MSRLPIWRMSDLAERDAVWRALHALRTDPDVGTGPLVPLEGS